MSRLTKLLRLVAAALALAAPPALSAQGDLDPGFGTGGIVQTDLDGPLLATPDGKLVVAGSDPGGMRVSRWLPSGALDTSFGIGGSVLIGLRQAGAPNGIYRQSTGAIVVVGSYSSSADGTWLALARLAANGAPDPSFGVDGLRILALGGTGVSGTRSGAGVGVQPDDSIVYRHTYQTWIFPPIGPPCPLDVLHRLDPDGGDDPPFVANLRAGFPSCFDSVGINVALDRVGRAVGAGFVVRWNLGRRLLLMRWSLDGAADPSLGGIGYVELATPGTDDRWNALAFPPGSIAVAGVQQGAPIVGRHFEDGTLDPAFGTGGVATIVSPDQVTPRALLIQADGAHVVAGRGVRADGSDGLFLFRILPSGAPDPAFGVGGASFVAASPGQDLWAALQPDGKIVVAADGKLHRFIGLVPCAGFGDVDPASPFCPNVEWVRNRAITLGCTSTSIYCPTDPVSRLAAAAFFNRLGTSLADVVLWNEGAPGALDLDASPIACQTADFAVAGFPRQVHLDSVLSGTASVETGFASALVASFDGGVSWVPVGTALLRTSVSAGHWRSVRESGRLDLDVGQAARFGVRASRDGLPGAAGLDNSRCVVRARVGNRNGASPPYDPQ